MIFESLTNTTKDERKGEDLTHVHKCVYGLTLIPKTRKFTRHKFHFRISIEKGPWDVNLSHKSAFSTRNSKTLCRYEEFFFGRKKGHVWCV